MKNLIIFLLLIAIPVSYTAQTFTNSDGKTQPKSSSMDADVAKKQEYWYANSTEIFIEVVIEEYFDGKGLRIDLNLGDNYNSSLSRKEDIKLFDNLINEVTMMNNIPDLLGYLAEEGFIVVNYATYPLSGYIRHQIILSQRFSK